MFKLGILVEGKNKKNLFLGNRETSAKNYVSIFRILEES
jgi:hypothetical protein